MTCTALLFSFLSCVVTCVNFTVKKALLVLEPGTLHIQLTQSCTVTPVIKCRVLGVRGFVLCCSQQLQTFCKR